MVVLLFPAATEFVLTLVTEGDSSWSVPPVAFLLFRGPFDAVTLSLFSTACRFNFLAGRILSQVANEDVSGTLLVFFYRYPHLIYIYILNLCSKNPKSGSDAPFHCTSRLRPCPTSFSYCQGPVI